MSRNISKNVMTLMTVMVSYRLQVPAPDHKTSARFLTLMLCLMEVRRQTCQMDILDQQLAAILPSYFYDLNFLRSEQKPIFVGSRAVPGSQGWCAQSRLYDCLQPLRLHKRQQPRCRSPWPLRPPLPVGHQVLRHIQIASKHRL